MRGRLVGRTRQGYSWLQFLPLLRMPIYYLLISLIFPPRCCSCEVKEVQPGVVGGEPVCFARCFHVFFFLFLLIFPLLYCPLQTPPGGHDSDATTARFCFNLSLFSLLAFTFYPSAFFHEVFLRLFYSYEYNGYFFASFSVARVCTTSRRN